MINAEPCLPIVGRSKTKIVLPGCESEARSGFSTKAVQTRVRVNVTCVTALGEEVASTS